MKHWLLAGAVLLCGAVGAGRAEYIIIKYNLTGNQDKEKPGAGKQPGVPGNSPPGGINPGGPMGPGGLNPMGPGGSFPGKGGLPGAGSFPGMMGPGGSSPPGGMAPAEDLQLSPLYVIAVVEIKNQPNRLALATGQPVHIEHRWGSTTLPAAQEKLQSSIDYAVLKLGDKPVASITKSFEAEYQKAHKEGKPSTDQLLRLAELALNHGLLSDFTRVMDELVEANKEHPAAVAYKKVQEDLDRAPAAKKELPAWKSKLGIDSYRTAEKDKGRYTILYNGPEADAQNRLSLLEDTFRGFYYWFALHGQVLPVPQERLLAVVIAQPDEMFPRTHQILSSEPLVSDGFYARRDNLVVFSGAPRDEAYKGLQAAIENQLRTSSADASQLLHAKGSNHVLQTAMLMLRALEQDAEVASISQEASRQLLAASGKLPRNVEVPEWVEFGIGSFFGTAKCSPWPSLGAPSTAVVDQNNFLSSYQVWSKAKKLDEPKLALERTVTDFYFRQAKASKDPVATHKARTLAWALTFYLARQRLDGLLRYYKELSNLPRDLEFDDKVLLGCFARAFELVEVNKPNSIDPAKFAQFANAWYDNVNLEHLDPSVEEVLLQLRKAGQSEVKTTGPTPAGQPGGQPGAPPAGPAGPPPAAPPPPPGKPMGQQ